jgi:hypothetical protein
MKTQPRCDLKDCLDTGCFHPVAVFKTLGGYVRVCVKLLDVGLCCAHTKGHGSGARKPPSGTRPRPREGQAGRAVAWADQVNGKVLRAIYEGSRSRSRSTDTSLS